MIDKKTMKAAAEFRKMLSEAPQGEPTPIGNDIGPKDQWRSILSDFVTAFLRAVKK